MLSIGKMVARSEDYYLHTVANGREEYYTGSGESPGYWLGEGARRLGLDGEVAPDDLRAVLAGVSPRARSSTPGRVAEAKRVAGFDLTFSAPKSVSLLYGLSDPDVSAHRPRRPRRRRRPGARLSRAPRAARPPRGRRRAADRGRGPGGGRLRAPDLAGGRPPAPHPRAGGQCRRRDRRHLVRPRRPPRLLPRPHGRLPLPGGAARRADPGPRGPLRSGDPRHGRARRGAQDAAARLFDPAPRDRAPPGPGGRHSATRGRSGGARHPLAQGRRPASSPTVRDCASAGSTRPRTSASPT